MKTFLKRFCLVFTLFIFPAIVSAQPTGYCGNGVLESGEQCDDGNLFDWDGCDSLCVTEPPENTCSICREGEAGSACYCCSGEPGSGALGCGFSFFNDPINDQHLVDVSYNCVPDGRVISNITVKKDGIPLEGECNVTPDGLLYCEADGQSFLLTEGDVVADPLICQNYYSSPEEHGGWLDLDTGALCFGDPANPINAECALCTGDETTQLLSCLLVEINQGSTSEIQYTFDPTTKSFLNLIITDDGVPILGNISFDPNQNSYIHTEEGDPSEHVFQCGANSLEPNLCVMIPSFMPPPELNQFTAVCGDGFCNYPETDISCPEDCSKPNITMNLEDGTFCMEEFPGGSVECAVCISAGVPDVLDCSMTMVEEYMNEFGFLETKQTEMSYKYNTSTQEFTEMKMVEDGVEHPGQCAKGDQEYTCGGFGDDPNDFMNFQCTDYPYCLVCRDCTLIACGNGVVEESEQCDDGNIVNGDGCDFQCRFECTDQTGTVCSPVELLCYVCVEEGCVAIPGSFMDCGIYFSDLNCNNMCASFTVADPDPVCGDGVQEIPELCDDGNLNSGDGCSSLCEEEELCFACSDTGGCGALFADEMTCNSFFSDPICSGTCEEGVVVTTPPTEEDILLCEDTSVVPEGYRSRVYGEETHISRCETEESVRYVICGGEEEVTINIVSCDEGDPCETGACIDLVDSADPFCIDTDPANSIYFDGSVVGVRPIGSGFSLNDGCSSGTSTYERICNADDSPGLIEIACPEGMRCSSAICIPIEFCEEACTDTDPSSDPHFEGQVFGVSDWCIPYSHSDRCVDGDTVREQICNADGTPSDIDIDCSVGERCEGGVCVPDEICEPTCVDSDSSNDIHTLGHHTGVTASCSSYATNDSCTTVDGVPGVREQICNADGTRGTLGIPCPPEEVCDSGRCVPEVPACERTECSETSPTPSQAGFVTGIDCVVQHNICEGASLVRFSCGADDLPAVAETVPCPGGCADGLCL